MSKTVRLAVLFLAILLLASAVVALVALSQKQTLQNQNQKLNGQLTDSQKKESDLQEHIKKLQNDLQDINNKITQTSQEKSQLQSLYDELKSKQTDLQSQMDQANADRDDWKSRAQNVTRQRDDLMEKLKNRPTIEKVVYKDRIVKVPTPVAETPSEVPVNVSAAGGDQYWASVLKDKTALQMELNQTKTQLDQVALQMMELKKQNSDFALQIKQLARERDELGEKAKYSGNLADTLSVELTQAQNYRKVLAQTADKIRDENLQLASQIRDLTAAKLLLEQTIARLKQEKNAVVSQSPSGNVSLSGGVELPPIIVNFHGSQPSQGAGETKSPDSETTSATNAPKSQGAILSINTDSNFIITDLGQANSPVAIGNMLKVYRNGQEIAALEVIQVRRDICAADIKYKSTDLNVGDVVKLI